MPADHAAARPTEDLFDEVYDALGYIEVCHGGNQADRKARAALAELRAALERVTQERDVLRLYAREVGSND